MCSRLFLWYRERVDATVEMYSSKVFVVINQKVIICKNVRYCNLLISDRVIY